MLYRIQTLYSLISIFIYSIALYYYAKIERKYSILLNKTVLYIFIICLVLSVISLLFFKNRQVQLLLNKINIAINAINFIMIIFFSFLHYYKLNRYILFIIFSSIYILKKTNKSIKKDIELIDSVNRIR